jgi:hypothetical protein
LPKVHTVDEAGKFVVDLAPYDLAGKFVKSAKTEAIIIEYLEKNNIPNNYDDKYPRFYENFNQYMKKVNNRMSHKPIKYYTYAE